MSDGVGRVFGIDLGTTYSAIAFVDDSGRPSVCRNTNNSETTPSVVHFESASNVVVGETAKQSSFIDADNVVSLIKRKMGQDETYSYHGEDYTPESISALILKALAADAANYADGQVEKVVITVPAYFGGREKKATENAGVIAGLDVVGIVPEPVAAAVHYDLMSGGGEKTVLVFDLGGGTFDTTVIRVEADEIRVICTDGATNLGGADWDARLRDHVLERFVAQAAPDESPEDDQEFMQEVALKVEDLKKQLSQQESRSVQLRFDGKAAKIEVTRAEFERMTADLLDSAIEILKRTLVTLEEKSSGAKIDEVLLVGGSTKMPAVAARLVKDYGWAPKLHDPDLAVAKGAAIWGLSRVVYRMQDEVRQKVIETGGSAAQAEQAADEVADKVARDHGMSEEEFRPLVQKRTISVLPHAFGAKLQDSSNPDRDYIKHLAFANDPLPTGDRTLTAYTVVDNQTSVEILIYEQEGTVLSEELEHNKELNHEGNRLIEGIPPKPKGQPLDISMSIDEDGLLQLHAQERNTGKLLTISVTVGMSPEDVAAAKQTGAKISVSS